jgi:hypothetical protein
VPGPDTPAMPPPPRRTPAPGAPGPVPGREPGPSGRRSRRVETEPPESPIRAALVRTAELGACCAASMVAVLLLLALIAVLILLVYTVTK